jgi:hypothetical protein
MAGMHHRDQVFQNPTDSLNPRYAERIDPVNFGRFELPLACSFFPGGKLSRLDRTKDRTLVEPHASVAVAGV